MKRLARFAVALLLLLIPVLGFSEEASPPLPPPKEGLGSVISPRQLTAGTIKAVVVKSWDGGGASAWQQLNSEWPSYGSIPIFVDTATLGGATSFTYQDLVNTGANVVILSDPAGGIQQYSASEISAILQYASQGHNVIGTFKVFQWEDVDNRGLAPVFGLRSDIAYNTTQVSISNQFNKLDAGNFLFTNIPGSSWTSSGYPNTETPSNDLQWNSGDLAGAGMVAQVDNFKGMISVFNGGGYRGIYISNMPEFGGGTLDKQLLYNAIVALPLGQLVPVPDIRANGSDGPVTIAPGDTLRVTVALDPGSHEGEPADWWVAAASPFGFYWYTLDAGWVRSDAPIRVYGGPLFSLPAYPVLEISTLPAGAYTFYFGCDMAMNDSLDMDRLYYDRVEVNITP